MNTIWLVDDDPAIRFIIEDSLNQWGYRSRAFADGRDVLDALKTDIAPDLIISDIRMRHIDGLALLEHSQRRHPGLPFIITTAYADLDNTVHAYQQDAYDYLPKPFDLDELQRLIAQALRRAPDKTRQQTDARDIIGDSPAMQQLYRAIGRLAKTRVNILISGETGTGKELIARALHKHSPAADGLFIALNMAAIPPELAEAELFGHEKGAFTGATHKRPGRFAQADGGTLFLDEIGDMPLALQAKLLRTLADGSYYPIASQTLHHANARIIAASHKNLGEQIAQGRFREDLYHRLNVIHLHLPPLRERREDIPQLLAHHLHKAAYQHQLPEKKLTTDALARLKQHPWPGNIRELENLCQQLTIMHPAEHISATDLPPLTATAPAAADNADSDWTQQLAHSVADALIRHTPDLYRDLLATFDHTLIATALQHSQYHKQRAAERLGIGRNTLARKWREQDPDQ